VIAPIRVVSADRVPESVPNQRHRRRMQPSGLLHPEDSMIHALRKPPVGLATGLAVASVLAAGLAVGQQESTPAADPPDPSMQSAESMPRAARSLILDITNGSARAIAVGERGHILVSESRREWRQIDNVPTRTTLTAVTSMGDHAWAVGHDGVILHSADGGLTWERQRATPFQPGSDDPHNGAPLLDVLFLDQSIGIAIGAYSLMLRTGDGGATWGKVELVAPANPVADAMDELLEEADSGVSDDSWTMSADETEIEEEADPHLNGIARTGDGSLFIVAERGAAFRSTDGGLSWQRIALPYDGSMFGVIGYAGRHVLAFGLRGNVYESHDLGDNWTKVESGAELSLMGGAGWSNGGAALVGANGVVLTRSQGNSNLLRHNHPDGAVLASVLALTPNGELVLAGENGVSTWTPN
jgi:photosystem II stability/assembly factor-like uncharacterized protein